MKFYLQSLIWVGILTLIVPAKAFAQINIDFPSDRAVFQRNKSNEGTIYIAGSYGKIIDRVEAKLTPVDGFDKGFRTDWITIQDNLQGGTYSGKIAAQGGWYKLEVRGWRGNQLIDSKEISRVGVGEVFLIAGQSNGQGLKDRGSPRAEDDRVSVFNDDNTNNPTSDLRYPQFTHLEANMDIAPRGHSAWSWGKLGDILARRYGVPILFYNIAWTGSAIRNWRESLNGGLTVSVYDPNSQYLPVGTPYANMKSVMNYYVPITGLRSVLWIQGEADNYARTSSDSYFNDLKAVIEKSRNDSGKNISWMVSLTTYDNQRGIYNPVVDAQKRAISNIPNVFQGPNTDQVQIPRIDGEGVHFQNEGLSQLGEAWGNSLNDDFFARSEPFAGVSPLKVTIACAGNSRVNLTISNDGYNSFSWNNGQGSSQIQVGSGSYRATARDGKGNIISSPEIRVYDIQPQQPSISIEGTNPVCKDNSATLVSSISDGARWNTGADGSRLSVSTAGEYAVTVKNVYGCEATSAKTVVTVLDTPLPDKPTITVGGAVVFCDGGEVKLTSTSKVNSIWSNGAGESVITVKSSGDYRVKAIDNNGCYSPDSDPVTVKVNPLPSRPVISLSRSATFCANEEVVMTSNYDSGNTWNTSATSKTITVNTTGEFSLKQTDGNGCESVSDKVNVKVNPLPDTPTVASLRPTTFCERDFTTLQGSTAFSYLWSNGSTSRQIDIRESGDFSLSSRDANGCVSIPSPAVKVTKNPLPPTPKIVADGTTTFCADLSVNLISDDASGYAWNNGASSKTVNITVAGTFSVRTINEFTCYSDPSNSITTRTLALPPAPMIRALDLTTFCDGNSVDLVAQNGNLFFWSSGEENDTLNVTKSGSYGARIRDNAGCYSPYSSNITVDVKPQPEKPVIEKIGVYALFAKNNLNDEGAHEWKLDNKVLPETGSTLKASVSGNYVVSHSVVYSPTLTCVSEDSDPYVLFTDKDDVFVVYPNPTGDGKVTIETMNNWLNSTIQVIDSRGIIHKTFTVRTFDKQYLLNLSDLSSGVYFVRITSGLFSSVKKIVIAR